MKETCKECRYVGRVIEKGTNKYIDTWCHMKSRVAPKNPCKFWRPKARKEEQKCVPGILPTKAIASITA
jgi:hypothetical protein